MKTSSWLATIMILWFCCAHVSALDIPPACSGKREASGYNAGFLAGGSLVRQAWAKVKNCARIDEFERVVKTAIQRSVPKTSPTLYTQCRFSGQIAGMTDQVDGLFVGCADSCFLEGQFVGEITAIAYCELSILLRGLALDQFLIRGPVETCGLSFEIGCDANFETTAINYSNLLGQCLPYVRHPFLEVFEQAQQNQCAYDPLPPDELDP